MRQLLNGDYLYTYLTNSSPLGQNWYTVQGSAVYQKKKKKKKAAAYRGQVEPFVH